LFFGCEPTLKKQRKMEQEEEGIEKEFDSHLRLLIATQ
jgi:hypothetical protein